MKYCKRCGRRPKIWLNTLCDYCLNMPMSPDSAIEYENVRKQTNPEEFEDLTPKEIPVRKSGYGNFIERIESGGVGNYEKSKSHSIEDWENDMNTKLLKQSKHEEKDKTGKYIWLFILLIVVIIIYSIW